MDGKKINQLVKYIAVALVSVAATIGVMYVKNYDDIYLKQLIKSEFYGEIDDKALESAARKGMVEALGDKYTYYIDEEEGFENFTGQATGNYCGIGITITLDENSDIVVKYVVPDAPADKAGMLAGDLIVKVDGKSTEGLSTEDVSNLVKGERGEEVEITVSRNGGEIVLKPVRDNISATSITSKTFGDIGYVHMSSFDDDAHLEMKNHIGKMGDIKGLVIDLRDNPGGLLSTAVNTLDMFINEGKFIVIKYKNGEVEESIDASGKQIYKMPVVILTNENSASASELFTAAMKENERAISVGTTTYGKGSVQRSYPLGNDTGINLTVGRFFSPKGNAINEVGVSPDVKILNPSAYNNISVLSIPEGEDLQLLEALKQFK